MQIKYILLLISQLILLSSCSSTIERLKRVGRPPELATVELPETQDQPDPERLMKAEKHRNHIRKTNSLWQPGGTTFFRDNRAWQAGDILKVAIKIKDNASLNNSTQQTRKGGDTFGIPALFGKERAIAKTLSKTANPASLVNTNSQHNHAGTGNISRKEDVTTEIAATVTQVLPNGNLVIQGHQEVRVNHELREIKVAGIIRPKDISNENSIRSDQIAEARISYGGRGVVSDVQQPRVGSQVLDAISPF